MTAWVVLSLETTVSSGRIRLTATDGTTTKGLTTEDQFLFTSLIPQEYNL